IGSTKRRFRDFMVRLLAEQVCKLFRFNDFNRWVRNVAAGRPDLQQGPCQCWSPPGVPPPKTLITPALFSRPLHTPHTGRRGGVGGNGLPKKAVQGKTATARTPLPGRGMGWSGEGQGGGSWAGALYVLRRALARQHHGDGARQDLQVEQ